MCAFSKVNITENYRRLVNPQQIFEDSPSFRSAADKLHPDVIPSYLEAAIWSSGEEFDEFSIHDFSQDAVDKSKLDLEKFIDRADADDVDILDDYLDAYGAKSWGQLAHDFWLTRNGHGTGFWDRSEIDSEIADKLTEICKEFREVDVYVGDDGKLHIQ